MPFSSQHTSQAKHNTEFLKSFYLSYKFNDWAITVSFYASVHIIENAIAKKKTFSYKGKHIAIQHSDELAKELAKLNLLPKNYSPNTFSPHMARKLIVRESFSEIEAEFNLLYRNSRTARYRGYHWKDEEVDKVVKTHFKKIVEWSNKKFKTQFKWDL